MRYGHFGVLSVNYSYTQRYIGMLLLVVISSSTDVNVPGWGGGEGRLLVSCVPMREHKNDKLASFNRIQ